MNKRESRPKQLRVRTKATWLPKNAARKCKTLSTTCTKRKEPAFNQFVINSTRTSLGSSILKIKIL